ncbi:hypothetical protein QZH41_008438 [Actinostola sp. cb2023]|nr:hypothetical protein QZH41_008438 [Actinostola sp. cb2023]
MKGVRITRISETLTTIDLKIRFYLLIWQSKKQANCIADSRDRDRSPSGSNSKDNSPYSSNRHSNLSPRSQRSKFSYSRSKDGSKKGSSQSPNDAHHESNSHSERRTKFNHISTNEEFPWSQHVSSSGKVYYYNFKTEKSQWEKPKEWIERERRDKETKERLHGLVGSKDNRDKGFHKEDSNYEKSRTYVSKYSVKESLSNDRRDGNRVHNDDRGRENHHIADSDRGQTVIKTVSAHTSSTRSPMQLSPSSISPIPVQPLPVVNLQALVKYIDKSLTSHTSNWPTEGLDKQVQRLNDEGCCSASDASKIQIQQLHLQSQLDLLDMRLNVGSKR